MPARSVLPGGRGRLSDLAKAAAHDLAADAVVVTMLVRGGGLKIAATAGFTGSRPATLLPALAALEVKLRREAISSVRSLAAEQGEAAEALLSRGFGSVMTARIDNGSRRVGAMHLLRREEGLPENQPLVRAYASHVGVAIAGSRSRRRPAPPSGRVLGALSDLGGSARSFPELIQGLDAALAGVFGSGMSGIMLWDSTRDVLQMVPGSFGADERTAASYQIKVSYSRSNAARVFATGDPYLTNCARGDPAILQDYVNAFGLRRLLSVVLSVRGRRLGVLHLANKDSNYTAADVWRLDPLIPFIAQGIETAGRLFLLGRSLRLERVLSEVAVAITSGQSMQESLSAALTELSDVMDASLIALVPTHSPPILWHNDAIDAEVERRFLAQAGEQPERRSKVVGPQHVGDPGSAALYVPVKLAAQRIGTLSILRSRAEPFIPSERDALTRLAKLAALAWAAEGYQQQRAALARLEERQRIADDLHDDVAQILFGAQMALDAGLESPRIDPAVGESIASARALVIMADEALRDAIHQLSRSRTNIPAPELASLVSEIEREFGLLIHLDIEAQAAEASSRCRKPVRDALLRVAREALVNVAKHAGPCRASVRLALTRRGCLTLAIVDDGVGINPGGGRNGHGLTSLRRAVRGQGGMMRVESSPSGGTKVIARFHLR